MVPDVESQGEEDVVPNVHLHLGVLPRVDGHHVAVDHRDGAPGGGGDEV